jgi:sarcosine/dimethylglycine N-methyltransferase
LNISEVENSRCGEINKAQGIDHLIDTVDASFEDVPLPDASYDIVWSQDAILHSGERERVLEEVGRLLKPGGHFVFTDPMMADDCPKAVLKPILDRIHLETLGSPDFYRQAAQRFGLKEIDFEDHTEQLTTHYRRVLEETERRESDLKKVVAPEYIANMKKGLAHWVDGGKNNHLVWGIFHFRKR